MTTALFLRLLVLGLVVACATYQVADFVISHLHMAGML